MIYLDYAATTPLDHRVELAMQPFARALFGNPSSMHQAGRLARAAVDSARDCVADLLGARASEIIFTGSGTEADNLALIGAARCRKSRGLHIITTAVEHTAVLSSCRVLEAEGFYVTYLLPNAEGIVEVEQVVEAVTSETILVSVMYANNEVGTIQPIAEIGEQCRERGILFHSDAVQAASELPLSVQQLHVDLMSLSSHKVNGPKGIGLLYARAGTRLQPLIHGGGQENERRAGTENVAGIVGFSRALALSGSAEETMRINRLRDLLLDGLLAITASRLHGARKTRLSSNANVGFDGVAGETLLVALDMAGVAISTGAACSAGALAPSHVLCAMGYIPSRAQEAIRFSLGRFTTEDEVRQTIEIVRGVVEQLRNRE